ncbi:MAG: thioredoxin family protein [Candidatus Eremiobacteraeota bacterium]|nr:thioredoxin family protein [Candidatus Eremiobacteraeota bacterium]
MRTLIALCTLFLFLTCAVAHGGTIKVLNESDPGSKVDIEKYVTRGKITIFDFFATWCGPCNDIAPYLEKLQKDRHDVQVHKIDIKEWGSPVCTQYDIKSVPNFRVYDSNGKLQYQGKEAYQQVILMIKGAGGK